MTNLEQIAKQVSLLNRLIELLRMQEDRESEHWNKFVKELHIANSYMQEITGADIFIKKEYILNSENIQKAWSDELVKVVKELDKNIELTLTDGWCWDVLDKIHFYSSPSEKLEAILNKYNRSLIE
jgi:hypothetical protein